MSTPLRYWTRWSLHVPDGQLMHTAIAVMNEAVALSGRRERDPRHPPSDRCDAPLKHASQQSSRGRLDEKFSILEV